ncbi:hypothetical protein [Paenibacillus sp. PDC88]|uniref:hypothetical protein n=1 Tax=Paenibacillus sp. PDC88 TaxID=1884375 RepID=UPI000896E306|nr:hypothetical protein [Paenibacillus sp. PDC88]SDW24041.1 hypothetical protein SAMN05518848_101758 [Paenibacillus sp. PDC88]
MKNALTALLYLVLYAGFFAAVSYVLSLLITFVFEVDFGLIKAAALIVIVSILGGAAARTATN